MRKALTLLFISVLLKSCSSIEVFHGKSIRQYATSVIDFSSQYSSTSWSANRALGKENVYPIYGDRVNAWASSTADEKREHLVLAFDTLQTVRTVEVYETWYPGAIDSLFIRNAETKKWVKIYSKPPVTDLPAEARIFTIYIKETTFLADAIRIAINSPAVEGWNEIDAVAISGQRKNTE